MVLTVKRSAVACRFSQLAVNGRHLWVNDLYVGAAFDLSRQEVVQHEPRRRENRWVKRADHDDPDLTDLRVDPHNLYLWSPHRTMVDPLQHGATTYPFKVGLGARVYGIPPPTTSSMRHRGVRRPRGRSGSDGRRRKALRPLVRVYSVPAGFVVPGRGEGPRDRPVPQPAPREADWQGRRWQRAAPRRG